MKHNNNSDGLLGRSVAMDIPKLRRCLNDLGWTNARLAQMADVETRTVERILHKGSASRKVYAEILHSIQIATRERLKQLGLVDSGVIEPDTLELFTDAWNQDESRNAGGTATFTSTKSAFVEITIEGDFEDFSEAKQEEFLDRIQAYLKSPMPPEVIQIRRGSVKVTLRVSPVESERLLFGIKGGDLEAVGIVDAEMFESNKFVKRRRKKKERRQVETATPTGTFERTSEHIRPIRDQDISGYFKLKAWPSRCVGFVLLVTVAPAICLLIALIRMTSPGPGLYCQTRVGKDGKEFPMYKLRTMYREAETVSGPTWCNPGDCRVTPLGRVLRLLHLDELPTLINVVRGEMDLVGPRPERPVFVEWLAREVPVYRDRLKVLPGIAGLAQINLKPDETIECVRRKLILDREYIRSASLFLDVRILLCSLLQFLGVRHGRALTWFRLKWIPKLPHEVVHRKRNYR